MSLDIGISTTMDKIESCLADRKAMISCTGLELVLSSEPLLIEIY